MVNEYIISCETSDKALELYESVKKIILSNGKANVYDVLSTYTDLNPTDDMKVQYWCNSSDIKMSKTYNMFGEYEYCVKFPEPVMMLDVTSPHSEVKKIDNTNIISEVSNYATNNLGLSQEETSDILKLLFEFMNKGEN